MLTKTIHRAVWLFTLAFVASGCDSYNLFSGNITVEQKAEQILKNDNPEQLLVDAKQLIAEGEPEQAQKVLEKAQSLEPDNGEIRIQHANAVLLSADIDVFDLRNMADYLSTGDPGVGVPNPIILTKTSAAEFCSDKPSGGKAPFDLEGYLSSKKLSNDALFVVLEGILNPVFATITPGMARNFVVAALKSKKVENIGQALLLYSMVVTVKEYNKLKKFAKDNGAIWYNFSTQANATYLGYCTNDSTAPKAQERCQSIFDEAKKSMGKVEFAVELLEMRAFLLGSDTATELSDLARDGYDAMDRALQSAKPCQP